jgi:alpha-L-fucosidase
MQSEISTVLDALGEKILCFGHPVPGEADMRVKVFVTIAALLLAMLGFPAPARADLLNPRQTWLRNSTAGLFLHWGMRTSPGYTSCSAWESAITNGGWDANYWVQEAQKLHVQYLVLASFHSRLGYGRPWPSRIPGSCSTRRDFLGETIAAAKAKGLKVILYMTDDPQWFWEGLQPPGVPHDPTDMTQPSWFDSAAYSKFKGHPTNLNTRPGFGEFSYDNFFEVMRRYGSDLGGFWIDNDNAYWEQHNLYQQIHQLQPTYLLSNNNEDTPEMDTVSNEQKTGMTPSYDYPQAVWTPQPRLTEADYKLPVSGSWWYDGSNSRVDYKLTLGRMITNVGSSIKALEAETAQVNGVFPSNQAAFNDFANGYLTPIWSSLSGVEGGGYMYGGLQPGAWNDGAYGVTTVSRTDPNLHYIHAIDRPSGDVLRVRDNGYRVSGVSDLRTGTPLAFSQAGGVLTIRGELLGPVRHRVQGGDRRSGRHPGRSRLTGRTVPCGRKLPHLVGQQGGTAGHRHARPRRREAGRVPRRQPAGVVGELRPFVH